MVKVKDWRGTVCSSEHRHVTAGRLSFWTLHLVEASLCGVCTFSPCLCVSSGCSGFLPRSRDMALCGELHVGVNVGSTGCLCLRVSALVTRWQPKDERLSIWMERYEVMSEVSRKTWMSDSHILTLLASCSIKPSFYWRRRVMRNIKKKNSETSLLQFLAHREKGGLCLFQSIESLLCETSIKEVLHFIASIASCWAKGGLSWIRRWERYFCSKENLRVCHDNVAVTPPEYSKCDGQLKWEQIRQQGSFLLKNDKIQL